MSFVEPDPCSRGIRTQRRDSGMAATDGTSITEEDRVLAALAHTKGVGK